MREYLAMFFEEFGYPEEARETLISAYDAVCASAETGNRFEALLKMYEDDVNCDMNRMIDEAGAIAEAAGVHEYTMKLLLFICMSRTLREYYRAEGLDEEIWHTCMLDLKYKLIECRLVHGVWGSFVAGWFVGFFRLTRFGFGKLQFELIPFGRHYRREGFKLLPESNVVNIHIPRTGGRLDGESLKDSISGMIDELVDATVAAYLTDGSEKEDWNVAGLHDYFFGWLFTEEDTAFTAEKLACLQERYDYNHEKYALR